MLDLLICLVVAISLVAFVYAPAWLYKLYEKTKQRKVKPGGCTGLTNVEPSRTDITYGQSGVPRLGERDADGKVERKAVKQNKGSAPVTIRSSPGASSNDQSSFDQVLRQQQDFDTYMGVMAASAATDQPEPTPPSHHSPSHSSHYDSSSSYDHGHHSPSGHDSHSIDSGSWGSDSTSSSSDSGSYGGGDD